MQTAVSDTPILARPNKNAKKKVAEVSLADRLKLWMLPIVVLTFVIVSTALVVFPWYTEIQEKRDLIETRELEVTKVFSKLELLVNQDQDALQEYLLNLELVVPGKVVPPVILASLEKALTQVGLSVDGIQFRGVSDVIQTDVSQSGSSSEPNPNLPQATLVSNSNLDENTAQSGDIDIQLAARGEYFEIVDFLKLLESTSPLVAGVELAVQTLEVAEIVEDDTNDDPEGEESEDVATTVISLRASAPFQSIPTNLGAAGSRVVGLSEDDFELLDQLNEYTSLLEVADISDDDTEPVFPQGKDNPF